MSDQEPESRALDPAVERDAISTTRRALEMIERAEAARLEAFLEAGALLRQAKVAVGHGNWLLFIDHNFPRRYAMIRRAVQFADGMDEDSWLAEQVRRGPEDWSIEKAVEYLRTTPELRREMREQGVITNDAGTSRVPLAEAGSNSLRHHKRFAAGLSPKPDPLLAELAKKSRWIEAGSARIMVDEWIQCAERARARRPLALEDRDSGAPEALDRLILSLSAAVEVFDAWRVAEYTAKIKAQALRQLL